MAVKEVPLGRLRSPFYGRQVALDTQNRWHDWQGYTVPDALYCAETEYFAIRNATSVFDLSPMSKYRIRGPQAGAFLDRLVTRDMSRVPPGRVAYVVWCDDRGQVEDDGTVFHLAPDDYRLCAQERHFDELTDAAFGFDVDIAEETHAVAALAVQGPTSFSVLAAAGMDGVDTLAPFDLMECPFADSSVVVSRTGFTGDLGYELFVSPEHAGALWDVLFAAGKDYGIRAIGGDALALARVEAGFLQTGIDFQPAKATVRSERTRSPFELGLGWLVDFGKPVFNGRRALAEEQRRGSRWRFLRLDIAGNKPAHNAYLFASRRAHKDVGFVTSAVWSPVCKQNIALATVDARYGNPGDTLYADIYYQRELHWSRALEPCRIVKRPFWSPPRRNAVPPQPC